MDLFDLIPNISRCGETSMSESQLNYICSVLVMKKNQLTRKHSSRMHSARLCGDGWGMVMGRGVR